MRRRACAASLACVLLAAVAAGCGSSKSTSTGSQSSSSSSKAPSGSPVLIHADVPIKSLVVTGFTNITDGANLAAKEVNASGGIDGHPVKIVTCDTTFTPAGDLKCARQAVSDHAIASLTNLTTQEPTAKVFAAGKVVQFPAVGGGVGDYGAGTPNAAGNIYDPTGGGPASFMSVPFWMKKHGLSKLALAAVDVPDALLQAPFIAMAAKAAGIQFVGTVKLPLQPGDFTTQAEQLKKLGADTVVFTAGPPQTIPLIKAAWSIGFKPTWAKDCSDWWTAQNQQLGALQSPVFMACAWPANNSTNIPAVQHFNALLNTNGENTPANQNITTIGAYATVKAIAEIANNAKASTPQAFSAAIAKSGPVDVIGLFNWTPSSPGIKGLPVMNSAHLWWYLAKGAPQPQPIPGGQFNLVSALKGG